MGGGKGRRLRKAKTEVVETDLKIKGRKVAPKKAKTAVTETKTKTKKHEENKQA